MKLQDHIDHRLLRLCWVIPPYAEDETIALELFAGVLADTVWSPLVTRLMVDNTLATEVSAFIEPGMLASYFNLRIELQPGVDPAAVERHAQEALDEMLTSTLNPDLLVQSQQLILQNLLASWSDTLSLAAELGRHELSPPGREGLRQRAVRLLSISADAVVDAARRWLHQGRLVLQVDPITAASPFTLILPAGRQRLPWHHWPSLLPVSTACCPTDCGSSRCLRSSPACSAPA
ncbi:insulinase family protein [Klebsiella pneumoniae subsp. pneumoniae]|nr:insulinase family protein [Klebsiella pneumoniae subsp. pneumoniae]